MTWTCWKTKKFRWRGRESKNREEQNVRRGHQNDSRGFTQGVKPKGVILDGQNVTILHVCKFTSRLSRVIEMWVVVPVYSCVLCESRCVTCWHSSWELMYWHSLHWTLSSSVPLIVMFITTHTSFWFFWITQLCYFEFSTGINVFNT